MSPGTYNAAYPDRNIWTEYGYDSVGRRIWSKSLDGRYHGYTRYDAAGRVLWTVENPVNGSSVPTLPLTIPVAFHPNLPDGNIVTFYGYDGLGRTTLVTQTGMLTGTLNTTTLKWSAALTRTTRTDYDERSRPVTVTQNYVPGAPINTLPDVNIQTYTYYDGAGNVTWQSDAGGRWTRIEYDALSRPVTVTVNFEDGDPEAVDSDNLSWTDGSDTDIVSVTVYDLVTERVERTIQNHVDGSFDLVATMPITDRITIPSYDGFGRVLTTTMQVAPGGSGISGVNRTSTTAYDAATGRMLGSRDPLGIWSSSLVDGLHRPLGSIQNCRTSGGVAVVTGCAGWSGTYPDRNIPSSIPTYDALWRAATSTDPLGRVTTTTYDQLGRAVSTTRNDQNGQPASSTVNVQTTTTYNGLGQVVATTDAVGATTTQTYDGLGRQVSRTDPLSRTTTMGPRWSRTPDGRLSVTLIDGLGRSVASITNYEDGVVTGADGVDRDLLSRTVYDRAGNAIKTIASDGQVTGFGYDQLGRLIEVTENVQSSCGSGATDCNVVTTYRYDRLGNRIAITDARSNTRTVQFDAADQPVGETDALARTTSWTYSDRGEQLTRTDGRGTVTTAYDDIGRRIHLVGSTQSLTQTWSYDILSRLASWTDLSGPAGTNGTLTYGYDALNRVTSIADPRTGTVGYRYTARSEPAGMIYPDTTVVSSTYTLAGELDTVFHGATTLADYGYDTNGRLATLSRNNGLIQTSWTYDNADQVRDLITIVSGTQRARFQYTVNRAGQRTVVTDTLGLTSLGTSYTYDALRRVTGATESAGKTYAYTYDQVGNRLTANENGTITGRSYDAANQVSGWTYDAAGNLTNDGTRTYNYDLLNRLTSTTASGTTVSHSYHGEELTQSVKGGSTTKFVQDRAGGLSQVLQTIQGGTTTTSAYGHERLTNWVGATRTWDVTDALGSVHGTLDNAGALQTTQQFDPWGQPTGSSQPVPWGFTGEYQDPISGLVYLRARWYQPSQGTMLGRDPFAGRSEQPSSIHPYQYAWNGPTMYADPSGRDPERQPSVVEIGSETVPEQLERCDKLQHDLEIMVCKNRLLHPNQNMGMQDWDPFTWYPFKGILNDAMMQTITCVAGGMLPVIGEGIDIYELTTRNPCGPGDDMSNFEYILTVFCAGLPFINGGIARGIVRVFKKIFGRNTDEVIDGVEQIIRNEAPVGTARAVRRFSDHMEAGLEILKRYAPHYESIVRSGELPLTEWPSYKGLSGGTSNSDGIQISADSTNPHQTATALYEEIYHAYQGPGLVGAIELEAKSATAEWAIKNNIKFHRNDMASGDLLAYESGGIEGLRSWLARNKFYGPRWNDGSPAGYMYNK